MSNEIKVVCSDGVEITIPECLKNHSDYFREVSKNMDIDFWNVDTPGDMVSKKNEQENDITNVN